MSIQLGKVRKGVALAVLLGTTVLAGFAGPALAAPADDLARRLEALEKNLAAQSRQLQQQQELIEAQAAQIQDLKRTASATTADLRKAADEAPKLAVANGRPTFSSGDGKTTIALRALLQYDAAYYAQKAGAAVADLSSGTGFRRARLGFDGRMFADWSYALLYDMGGSGTEGSKLADAYLQYDGIAPLRLRTGAFATPQGIEDQTSSGDLLFMERAAPTELARGVAGADGRKNLISAFASDDDYYAAASWSLARVGDAATLDAQNAAVGRLAYRVHKDPNSNVVLSASGSHIWKLADAQQTPAVNSPVTLQNTLENNVDTTRLVSTGAVNAKDATIWGLEAAANWKNLYGHGGYFRYSIDRRDALPDPSFDGWFLQASWVLTGEARRYNSAAAAWQTPRPGKPLDLKTGDLGAFELAARYSTLDLDYRAGASGLAIATGSGGIRGGRQEGWTVGLNWYPNSVVRVLLNYQHLDVDRLNAATPFTDVGQKVDILSARAQLAF